jgi:hypothetical protein
MPFTEIIKREIGENKFIVVSRRDDGKFSIAQQVIVESDGKEMSFFMKNAIIVGENGLTKIIEALNTALKQK